MTGSDSADDSADNLKLVSAQTQHRATLFHFYAYNLVFSLLFRSVGYGKPSLSCKLFIYLHYITLRYITLKVFSSHLAL